MIQSNTARGFSTVEFVDRYGDACIIQKSSLATEDAIWFGIQDACPQIMASDALAAGVDTDETTGWVPYPMPKNVLLTTRMHLTREMVADLLPILQNFVATGELKCQE